MERAYYIQDFDIKATVTEELGELVEELYDFVVSTPLSDEEWRQWLDGNDDTPMIMYLGALYAKTGDETMTYYEVTDDYASIYMTIAREEAGN